MNWAMRKGLNVQVKNGRLWISIPTETLAWAAEHREDSVRIHNCGAFAMSVRRALEDEGEDGSTPVTRLLDAATDWVVEQGEDGPLYEDD